MWVSTPEKKIQIDLNEFHYRKNESLAAVVGVGFEKPNIKDRSVMKIDEGDIALLRCDLYVAPIELVWDLVVVSLLGEVLSFYTALFIAFFPHSVC